MSATDDLCWAPRRAHAEAVSTHGPEATNIQRVHRLGWRLLLVAILIATGALAGFAVASAQPDRVTSSLTFYVALTPEVGLDIANSGSFVEQRSRSYVAFIQTDEFARRIDEAETSDSQLTLSANYRSGTALIDVTVSGPSSDRVNAAAQNLATQLPESVAELDFNEGAVAPAPPPLRLRPLGQPSAATDADSALAPSAMGGVAGLVLGAAILAAASRRSSGRHATPDEATEDGSSPDTASRAI